MSKHAVARMTWAMAQELREHGIAALAVAPGFMRTERVEEAFRRAGALAALNGPGGPKETTAYLGRAIVALASDPKVLEKSGQVLEVAPSRASHGFTDMDGSQPPPFRIPAPQEPEVSLGRPAIRRRRIDACMDEVEAVAGELLDALDRGASIQSIAERILASTGTTPIESAPTLCRRRRARGERPVGRKIGFTNRNIWAEYGATARSGDRCTTAR